MYEYSVYRELKILEFSLSLSSYDHRHILPCPGGTTKLTKYLSSALNVYYSGERMSSFLLEVILISISRVDSGALQPCLFHCQGLGGS